MCTSDAHSDDKQGEDLKATNGTEAGPDVDDLEDALREEDALVEEAKVGSLLPFTYFLYGTRTDQLLTICVTV